MSREWNGIQQLPRPINVEWAKRLNLICDVFYRRRLDMWIVWAFLPPTTEDILQEIVLLGGFKDRARARFAADTALAAAQQHSSIMPMMIDLLEEAEGDFLSVLHGISHVADASPWMCPHVQHKRVLSPLGQQDLDRLCRQIERHDTAFQDWRFMWIRTKDTPPSPSLIRIRENKAVAALVLEASTFTNPSVKFWLDSKEHQLPCRQTRLGENPLSVDVLDNMSVVLGYCDKFLSEHYGAEPSNAEALIAALREEGFRESNRQIAQAFGTAGFVGEA